MVMSAPLVTTLKMLADAATGAADPWWIIGSAAVALHGGDVSDARDVDLLMSERDAEAFLRSVGVDWSKGAPSDRFHSPVFGVWHEPPLPVEAFGGFQLATGDAWREVRFSSRDAIAVGGATLYVPSVAELRDLLHSFGRTKDLKRASLLGA